MGQRHQIYFVLPFEVENNGKKINKVGLHNQWLYGQAALSQLHNALSFIGKQDKYGPLCNSMFSNDATEVCKALYSINTSTGYYHAHHVLDIDECEDPDLGDNNDGITVIDARDMNNIKYCFMWLEANDYGIKGKKCYKPISAKDYVKNYYSDKWLKSELSSRSEALKKDDKLTEDERTKNVQEHLHECMAWQSEVYALADEIDKLASLLSPKEAEAIFPKMLTKHHER